MRYATPHGLQQPHTADQRVRTGENLASQRATVPANDVLAAL